MWVGGKLHLLLDSFSIMLAKAFRLPKAHQPQRKQYTQPSVVRSIRTPVIRKRKYCIALKNYFDKHTYNTSKVEKDYEMEADLLSDQERKNFAMKFWEEQQWEKVLIVCRDAIADAKARGIPAKAPTEPRERLEGITPENLDILRTPPSYTLYIILNASALNKLNRTKEALEFVNEYMVDYDMGDAPELLIIKAESFFAQKKYEQALKHVLLALAQDTNNGEYIFLKANILLHLNRFAPAIECADECINLLKNKSTVYYNQAFCLKAQALGKLNMCEEALKVIEEAMKVNSTPLMHEIRAVLLAKLGQFGESELELRAVLKKDPENMSVMRQLVTLLLSADRAAEALLVIDTQYLRSPKNAELMVMKAGVLYSQKKIEDAISCADLARQLEPNNYRALSLLAILFSQCKMFTRALRYAESALEIDSSEAAVWAIKGICHEQLGDFNPGKDALEKALALDPKNASAHHTLASLYFKASNYDLALEHVNLALEYKPKEESPWILKATILQGLRRIPEAQQTIKDSAQFVPELAKKFDMFVKTGRMY